MLHKQDWGQWFLSSAHGGRRLHGVSTGWKVVLTYKLQEGCDSTCVTRGRLGVVPRQFPVVMPLSQQRGGPCSLDVVSGWGETLNRRKGLAAMVTTKPLLHLHYPVKVEWKDRRWSFLVDLEDTCTPHFVNACLHCLECGSASDWVFKLSDSIPCMISFIQGSQSCLQSLTKLVNWCLPVCR